jgi:WD40 repeat protein
MIAKAMRLLVLGTMMMGVAPSAGRSAEPLPPRALARLGDHRCYHGPRLKCAALSGDGRFLGSSSWYDDLLCGLKKNQEVPQDGVIVLWDAASGEHLRELRVPHAGIQQLAFSRDGTRLATVYDISLRKMGVAIFATESGKRLWQKRDFDDRVSNPEFSADGKQLHLAGLPVRTCDADTGKLRRQWEPPPATKPSEDKEGVRASWGILSPDGKLLAWEIAYVGEKDNSLPLFGLHVHDADTDKLLYQKKLNCHRAIPSFAFSADSKRLAALCDGFTVWETAGGKELFSREIPDIHAFALTPDGRQLLGYQFHSRLRWWNLDGREPPPAPYPVFVDTSDPDSWCAPQVFSADGKTLLLATHTTLRLFDAATGKERGASKHRAPITPRFSADGRTLLTFCADRRCRWDVSAKEPVQLSHEPRKSWEFECLAHSADGRYFLDRPEDRARVRETATGRILQMLEPYYARFGWFSPDATRVLLYHEASERHPREHPDTFRLYDARTGKRTGEIKAVNLCTTLLFSPNGQFVAWADSGGAVHLHDSITGKAIRTLSSSRPLPEAKCDLARLVFSPDAEQLIVAAHLQDSSRPIRVFPFARGREISRFYADPDKGSQASPISCMACSPDHRLLAVAEENAGIVRLLEIASGKVRAEFAAHRHGVHGLDFAPDGKTLASGGEDNVVFLWDVTGTRTPAVKPPRKSDLASLWNDLASEDAKRAGVAIASLLRKPEASVAFLQKRLRPADVLDQKRLAHWIADLDADVFETREAASRELTRLGERAEAALRHELTNRPSLEMRRRIEVLLEIVASHALPPESLQVLRAIEVLERIGTLDARRCLEMLAKGAMDARATHDSKAALHRLANNR